ncbi:galactonate dehydratase [Betaproteobacteria bacterium]|nr:galactonate dehydratase [Betaproteobacteria bacterium]
MKITDVQVYRPFKYVLVKITTDEGIYGVGESGTFIFSDSGAEVIKSFRDYLIGKDPLQIEHHWQYMLRCWHFRGSSVMGAVSAIDIALWDIAGKYFNTPVYQLLGGKCRDKIRVYHHVSGATIEEQVAGLKEAKRLGYTAAGHLSPFLDESRETPFFLPYAQMIEEAAERVGMMREAVGNDFDLCLELHRRLTPAETIAFAEKIEKYTPYFLEDPIPPDNLEDMELVARKTRIPIATGERLISFQEFYQLISKSAIAYARTSMCVCGGITGTRKIAAIAEARQVKIIPHNPISPVATMAALQFAAATENHTLLEMVDHYGIASMDRYGGSNQNLSVTKASSGIIKKMPVIENGFAIVPDAPGIGVELVDDLEEKFPPQRQVMITRQHIDGSIVDQ